MALNVAAGTLNTTTNAATNTVSVTSISGFDPSANTSVLFLWWNGRVDTTDAVGRRTHQTGHGAAVSSTVRGYATCLAQDTPTAMVTNRMQGNAACIGITTTGDAIDGLMDFDVWLSNGFRLIIDNAFVASYTIDWVVVSGSDITNATVSTLTKPTTTGAQDVNVGFVPNFIELFSTGQNTSNDTVATDSGLAIGAAKTGASYIWSAGSNDGASNAQSMSYCRSGEVMSLFNAGVTALEDRATFTEFQSSPSNGFEINWTAAVASNKIVFYVAIQFASATQAILGDLLTQTDTSTTVTEGSLSSNPKGGFLVSAGRAADAANTPTNHFEWNVGGFNSTSSRWAMAAMDQDGAGTAVVGTAVEFDECYVNMPTTAATVEGLMDITGVNPAELTFIMDDADPAQSFVWYVAFGEPPIQLAGTIAATGTVTGALTVHRQLASTIAATGTVAGVVSIRRELAGTIAGTSTVAGTLSVRRELASTIAATSTIDATLTNTAGAIQLAGTIAATATVSGTLSVRRELASTIAGASTITGTLSVRRSLATAIDGTSTVAGTLSVRRELATTIAASSTIVGTLSVRRELATVISGQSGITATLTNTPGGAVSLSGTIPAVATITGTLSVRRSLAATIAGQTGSITATLSGFSAPHVYAVTSEVITKVMVVTVDPVPYFTVAPEVEPVYSLESEILP